MQPIYKDRSVIENLLENARTIAVVGLTGRRERAGHYVPAYLQEQGYRIIPVNPYLEEALGEKAYPDLPSVPQPVDLVLVFRRAAEVPPVVEQAIATGAPAVWMQTGIIHEEAAETALHAGLAVVMDACMLVEHRRWKQRAK
jgi:predicted CoA-binding protein